MHQPMWPPGMGRHTTSYIGPSTDPSQEHTFSYNTACISPCGPPAWGGTPHHTSDRQQTQAKSTHSLIIPHASAHVAPRHGAAHHIIHRTVNRPKPRAPETRRGEVGSA